MTSFAISDEWKNEKKWANCSREELLKIVESFAMAYQVTLMKSKEKDAKIEKLKREIKELEYKLMRMNLMTNDLFASNGNERRLAGQAATPVAIDWHKDFGELHVFVFYIVETDSFMGDLESEEVQDHWGWHVYSRNFTGPLSDALVPLAHESGPYTTRQGAVNYLLEKGAILL